MWSLAVSTVMGLFKGKSSIMIDVVLILVVVMLIGGGVWKYQSMQSAIKNYQSELVTAKMINTDNVNKINSLEILNKDNIKKLTSIKTRYESDIALLQAKMIKDIQRVKTVTIIKDRIKYVQPSDDGNVSKVLKDTLEQISKMDNQ